MAGEANRTTRDREQIFQDVVGILNDLSSDWDMDYEGGIGLQTRLMADLGFQSIDVVQLIVAIEEHYQRKDLPFVDLVMQEGRYVDELKVADFVDFLALHVKA
jgi:acyl carrier protein